MLIVNAIRSDFRAFAEKVFAELNSGRRPDKGDYLNVVCEFLESFANSEFTRGILNLPPRHLKTILGSIALVAWLLGHNPGIKIMIVTYGEILSKDIAYAIRKILSCEWYKRAFTTRLSLDRLSVTDFLTEQGGAVFATSFGGAITGRGADVLILDDPVKISDAHDSRVHQRVWDIYDTEIASRLNNQKTGRVLLVAHRLDTFDLSGRLQREGGWRKLALPFIAMKRFRICCGSAELVLKKGQILRPEGFTGPTIRKIMSSDDFQILYQQDPPDKMNCEITADMIPEFAETIPSNSKIIVTIDPAEKSGAKSCYWVMQAWIIVDEKFVLVDQRREQSGYDGLRRAVMRFVIKWWPWTVLIEDTGVGVSLASHLQKATSFSVVRIAVSGKSKGERLRSCFRTIKLRRVQTKQGLSMRDEFIEELVAFPLGDFTDQVDAMTQMLNWFAQEGGTIVRPPGRPIGARAETGGPISDSRHAVYVSLSRLPRRF